MYLAIPVCLYASERLIRALRSSIKPVTIQKVQNCNYTYTYIYFIMEMYLIMLLDDAGSSLSRKCAGTSHVKASGFQIQEWAIHVCQLCCCFSI